MIGSLDSPRSPNPISTSLALAGRSMRRLRRSPGRLVGITLNPLVTLFAFGVLFANMSSVTSGTGTLDYVMPGAVMQVGLASVGPTAVGIAVDLRSGLVDRFRSLPISGTAVLVGHTLADLVVGLIGIVAVTAVGLAMGWRTSASLPNILAGYGLGIAFVYTMVWLGVVLGLSVRNLAALDSIAALSSVAFSFLSTAFLPASVLPSWFAGIAEWNPLSKVVNACRALWGNQPGDVPGAVTVAVAVLVVVLATSALFGMRAFRTANTNY